MLLLHQLRFIIYKRVLSSASLNTPSDLNKRVVKHAQWFKGPSRGKLRTVATKNNLTLVG